MDKPIVPDKRSRRHMRSQSLIEFSLVAPLFLLIIFFCVDIGRLLYTYTAISSAARDGSRTASLSASNFSDCQIIKQVELSGQGFPVVMDPNSLVGNSDPNNPSGLLQPTQPPPNIGYAYIWPAVTTPDNNCNSPVQRAISPLVKHVSVEIQYHFVPWTPFVNQFIPSIIIRTVSVETAEA